MAAERLALKYASELTDDAGACMADSPEDAAETAVRAFRMADAIATADPDVTFMSRALDLARRAQGAGEVPVGAVVVKDNAIIAEGWNQPVSTHDPTAHAEIVAMRAAAQSLRNYRLLDTTLYVTLEPCAMCATAMVHARVKRLVYAASDPRAGAIESHFRIAQYPSLNHRIECTGGVLAADCGEVLRAFFKERR